MMATLFEWKIKPGEDENFRIGWGSVTKRMHARKSLGSALFQAEDGTFCALALWPDAEARDAAFEEEREGEPKRDVQMMRAAIDREVRRTDLDTVDNLWLLTPPA